MKRIVFLHGRSQEGQDPNQLKRTWVDALTQGLERAKLPLPTGTVIEFPYYGDRLKALVDNIDSPLISGILLRGDDIVQRGAEELRAEMLAEMATAKALSPIDIRTNFGGPAVERGIQNWKWVQAILRTLDGTPTGQNLLDLVTRDVSIYLTYIGLRLEIHKWINQQIPSGPSLYVMHSLGTVVGYNILRERTDVTTPLLVTLGSPLGMRSVQKYLNPPMLRPGNPESWLNARDPQDVVALLPLDAKHFAVDPPVDDKSDVKNNTDNRHGIDGYLNDPIVATRIHDALLRI